MQDQKLKEVLEGEVLEGGNPPQPKRLRTTQRKTKEKGKNPLSAASSLPDSADGAELPGLFNDAGDKKLDFYGFTSTTMLPDAELSYGYTVSEEWTDVFGEEEEEEKDVEKFMGFTSKDL